MTNKKRTQIATEKDYDLARLLKSKEVTYRQMADIIGLSPSTCSRLGMFKSWADYEAHKKEEIEKRNERLRLREASVVETKNEEAINPKTTPGVDSVFSILLDIRTELINLNENVKILIDKIPTVKSRFLK